MRSTDFQPGHRNVRPKLEGKDKNVNGEITVVHGGDNIFSDLDLSEPQELLAKVESSHAPKWSEVQHGLGSREADAIWGRAE